MPGNIIRLVAKTVHLYRVNLGRHAARQYSTGDLASTGAQFD
jgi:hypothetical protein